MLFVGFQVAQVHNEIKFQEKKFENRGTENASLMDAPGVPQA